LTHFRAIASWFSLLPGSQSITFSFAPDVLLGLVFEIRRARRLVGLSGSSLMKKQIVSFIVSPFFALFSSANEPSGTENDSSGTENDPSGTENDSFASENSLFAGENGL
jgi:hypothetical protein